jgi:two-component system, chemotaxis family, CheB/CheR fusion protein
MRARGSDGFSSYARVLDEHPNEYIRLFNDLTINVTSFFRDRIAFNSLKEKVLPQILARKQGGCVRIRTMAFMPQLG